MRYFLKITLAGLFCFSINAYGGNEDRAGEAGASELLINPWARSSGLAGSNTASIQGIEAMNHNIAGLAFTRNTEIAFSNTSWLSGTDISINALGLAKKMGESGGVAAISVMSMSFGEIEVTTADLPDGGIGTYRPNYLNINMAYSRRFSNSISGGLVVKIISQSTADVGAQGVALDAGVNYVTGDMNQFKFGITLRNVGPTMKYSGNGLSARADITNNNETKSLTVQQRSNEFELPSLVNIGASYDFFLSDVTEKENEDDREEFYSEHRLTASGTFTSNSFTKDQIRIGAEYAFREMFMVRAGYAYESDITDKELSRTASTGPTFGATIEAPLGKEGSTFGIDYSYRVTRSFDGTHAIGVKLNF